MTSKFDPNKRTLFVVGDEKQCIYGFRGSRVDLILQFHKFYPQVTEIILNQNYRSTQPILDLAEKVISHNADAKKVGLFTSDPQSEKKVKYYLARNEKDEAEFIIKSIYELYLSKKETKIDNEVNHNKPVINTEETVFVPDEAENINIYSKKTPDAISSMFDIYLDTEDISGISPKSSLWASYGLNDNSLSNTYNPGSWQLAQIDWKNCAKLNDCVILYRTHSQSRAIEETLLKHRVPYKLVSGTRFLDRKEVKDVLSILRFVNNGNDKISLTRFLPLILPGVGAKTMEKIYNHLQDPNAALSSRYASMVEETFVQIAKNFSGNSSLIEFTKNLIEDIGYNQYLKGEYTVKEDLTSRTENIAEIYSLMLPFDNENIDLPDKLSQFLSHIMLISNTDSKEEEALDTPKISLMTLHQSKGLEYETVFLVGLEDGILPHQNSLMEAGGVEEEVRLAYVGVTRAKKNLFLLAADSRVLFGQFKANPVSRIFRPFLDSFAKKAY